MAKQKRRSAEEWSRDVAAWRRGGETAARYAKRKGLSVGSLRWWSWRLGRDHGRNEAVELVAVEVVPDPAARSVDAEQWRAVVRVDHAAEVSKVADAHRVMLTMGIRVTDRPMKSR